jgi:hypothetical protein
MLTIDKKFLAKLHNGNPDLTGIPQLPESVIQDIVDGFIPNRLWAREKASRFLAQLRDQTNEKPTSSEGPELR